MHPMPETLRVATWNIGHMAGGRKSRCETAFAALALQADVLVLTEFCPGQLETEFLGILRDGGLLHQIASDQPVRQRANRVLVVSREPLAARDVSIPSDDVHWKSNFLSIELPTRKLGISGVRVPWYATPTYPDWRERVASYWEWLAAYAATSNHQAELLLGDFNVSESSRPSRGGSQFRKMLATGWTRQSKGMPTFINRDGRTGTEIDHILTNDLCRVISSQVLREHDGFAYAGLGGLSDHAALICDLSIESGP